MMSDGIELYFDKEEGVWKEKPEPYCVVEFPTKEDYERFQEMVDFWNKHHNQEE